MLKPGVIWIRMYHLLFSLRHHMFYFEHIFRRCITNKRPLVESGTMGPKGHTFVVVPFKSESYSNQVKHNFLN